MDRREFLISTGGAAVVAASSASVAAEVQAASPEAVANNGAPLLRLSMPWADSPQGPADSAHRLVRRFQAMTNSRYRIEIGTGLDGSDLLFGSPHDFAHHHPAFAYFGGLPGASGLEAQDFAHWLAVGGGQMLWDDLAADFGWKPLLAGHLGGSPPLWSRAPITGLADLTGQPIAVDGLGADVARALGAEPVPLRADAAIRALSDGSVRAAEAGGVLSGLSLGAGQAARYATGAGLNGHGTTLALHIRIDTWDRLGSTDQAILAAAAAEAFHASLAEARAHERIARQTLTDTFGIEFSPWPEDIAGALDRIAEASIAHVAGYDARGARIDHSYMAFRSAVSDVTAPRRSRSAGAAIS